jgi:hypothetical protein
MERFYENDGLKVTFVILDGNLDKICIVVKDNDLYPKLDESNITDSFNKRLVNDWLVRIYQFIENSLQRVPRLYSEEEKKAMTDAGVADVKIVRSGADEMPREEKQKLIEERVCPVCNEKLIQTKSCCGGHGSFSTCSKCGRKYRIVVVKNHTEKIV